MKNKNLKLYSIAERKTVAAGKGIKSIDLSFEIKCKKEGFESCIRQSAKLLNDYYLEKVKTFSIRFELLD